jgi:hypothetical protein
VPVIRAAPRRQEPTIKTEKKRAVARRAAERPSLGRSRRETELVRAILDYLKFCPGVIAWRQNTGMAMMKGRGGKPQPVRFGVKGLPDIIGSVPWCWECYRPLGACDNPGDQSKHYPRGPRPFGFEAKRSGQPLAPEQIRMADTLADAGWLYRRVESIDDVRRALGR